MYLCSQMFDLGIAYDDRRQVDGKEIVEVARSCRRVRVEQASQTVDTKRFEGLGAKFRFESQAALAFQYRSSPQISSNSLLTFPLLSDGVSGGTWHAVVSSARTSSKLAPKRSMPRAYFWPSHCGFDLITFGSVLDCDRSRCYSGP